MLQTRVYNQFTILRQLTLISIENEWFYYAPLKHFTFHDFFFFFLPHLYVPLVICRSISFFFPFFFLFFFSSLPSRLANVDARER
ncbi:hypothetical protein PUN28_003894 [Cardiocondyla obscurior]|uniref:Uncharacterized protein n=1 Tax=Cardiocondyla obscurior TaxID=286306 RepID=A0AAW2GMH3_9HYME